MAITNSTKRPGDIYIAGRRTIDDWKSFQRTLTPGGDHVLWQRAFDEYFYARLSTRYLGPIKILQQSGSLRGEGFSIVAIQCTLIEFLESTVQGISYRYRPRRKGASQLGPHEYSDSGNLFVRFLTVRQPFVRDFDARSARDFYEGVRCGLLHEARTKNGWTIRAKGPKGSALNVQGKIIYRDNFQNAILEFIDWYEEALRTDIAVQQAFIRKFNSLC